MGITNQKASGLHQSNAFMKINNYCQALGCYKKEKL